MDDPLIFGVPAFGTADYGTAHAGPVLSSVTTYPLHSIMGLFFAGKIEGFDKKEIIDRVTPGMS